MTEILKKLQAPFPPEEIEWRVQSCGISNNKPWVRALAYIQARAIQKRLDEVFGWDGWTEEYRVSNTDIICRLGVKTSDGWIYKENGASNTDIEAFKGGISGAFKRVSASGYGIGRYLYSLEEGFAECQTNKPTNMNGWYTAKTKDKQTIYWREPALPSWALPEGIPSTSPPPQTPPTGQPSNPDKGKEISEAQLKKISTLCGQLLINETQGKALLDEKYKKSSLKQLSSKEASDFITYLLGKIANPQSEAS